MKATAVATRWEDVGIHSLRAGMTLTQVKRLLFNLGIEKVDKQGWREVKRVRRELRPKLTRVGFKV